MKKILIATLLLIALYTNAATVTGMVQQITGNWSTNTRVIYSNMSTPLISGAAIVTSVPKFSLTKSNGWTSNELVYGVYKVWIGDSPRDAVTVQVPNDSGTYDLWSLRTNTISTSSNAPSIVRGVAQGTNIITVTNNGVVTVHGTSVSSGSGGSVVSNILSGDTFLKVVSNANAFTITLTNAPLTNAPANIVTASNALVTLHGPQIAGLSNITSTASNLLRVMIDYNTEDIEFIITGMAGRIASELFLTNWANAISNYVTASTNSAVVTNWITTRQPASTTLSNLSGTGALTNASQFVATIGGTANNLTMSNAYVLTNLFFGPNTNCVFVVSNSSTTGAGVLHLCKSTNGVIGASVWCVNLTNGFHGIGTNNPAKAFHVGGGASPNAQVDGTMTIGTTAGAQSSFAENALSFIKSYGTYVSVIATRAEFGYLPTLNIAPKSGIIAGSADDSGGTMSGSITVSNAGTWRINTNLVVPGNVGINTNSPQAKLHVVGLSIIQSNAAPFGNITNPIVSGQFWTNTTGVRVDLRVAWTLNGSAVSGFPSLCMTNISSGESYNPTNSFVLTASDAGRTSFALSPGDYFIATNKSSGSASATVDSSFGIRN